MLSVVLADLAIGAICVTRCCSTATNGAASASPPLLARSGGSNGAD